MMALSKKLLEQEPSEIEMLLPWYASGTLNVRDTRRVEEALARDPELARQYAVISQEYAETIHLNESLGAPSSRAMLNLFAAIDAEPQRKPSALFGVSSRISNFFASLSPRTLAWSASAAMLALLLQAGVIGVIVAKNQTATYQTASLDMREPNNANNAASRANEPITRELVAPAAPAPAAPPRALVRFAADARMADVTALLDSYQASILAVNGGMFRIQFGSRALSKDDVDALMTKLQREKIVSSAYATQ